MMNKSTGLRPSSKIKNNMVGAFEYLTNSLCSVAELAEKPLYRVTCGDIGTTAENVETYLDLVLYLGKLWDCGGFSPLPSML
jgi:hypothetical protein